MSVRPTTQTDGYRNLLNALKKVQQEASQPIQHEEELQKLIDHIKPEDVPASFQETFQKISRYATNDLFIWAAAKQVHGDYERFLCHGCLKKWADQLNNRVVSVARSTVLEWTYNEPTRQKREIEALRLTNIKLEKIGQEAQLPSLLDPEDLGGVLGKLKPLTQDVLLEANKIPASYGEKIQEASLILLEAPTILCTEWEEKLLIERNKHSFSTVRLKDPTDRDVLFVLERCPHLTTLVISNSFCLTSNCFRNGHSKLETLTLDKTFIQAEWIDWKLFPQLKKIDNSSEFWKLFPQLKKIDNSSELKIYDLRTESPTTPEQWVALKTKVEQADQILCTNAEKIINQFRLYPSLESLDALLAIKRAYSKFFNPHSPDRQQALEWWSAALTVVLKEVRENCPVKEWQATPSLGKQITAYLLEDPGSWTKWSFYQRGLLRGALTVRINEGRPYHYVKRPLDFLKAEDLLRQQRSCNMTVFREIASEACDNLAQMENELFYKKTNDPLLVQQIKLLTRVIMEMSYRDLGQETAKKIISTLIHLLYNPNTKTHTENLTDYRLLSPLNYFFGSVVHASDIYHQPLAHSIACAFVTCCANVEGRESLLKHILTQYRTYKGPNRHPLSHYPLLKLIAGKIAKRDLPLEEQDTVLAERLLSYRGVFNEPMVSNELKEQYLNALVNGEFGGSERGLTEVLDSLRADEVFCAPRLKELEQIA